MDLEMDFTTTDPSYGWEELQARLAGSFTAQTSGLVARDLSLSGPEGEFARIKSRGLSGADVVTGPLNSTIERVGDARYRMITDGTATIAASPAKRSADSLEMLIGGRFHEARASYFLNRAAIHSPEGEEVARLKGNLTGRRYEVVFDPETEGALLAAIFLLYHVVAHRNRAFRLG